MEKELQMIFTITSLMVVARTNVISSDSLGMLCVKGLLLTHSRPNYHDHSSGISIREVASMMHDIVLWEHGE